jgi:hypothetical protein
LEGGPAVMLGLLVCWWLPPDPERAAFLQPAERQWCLDRWRIVLLPLTSPDAVLRASNMLSLAS